ncbi:hypothetical protein A3F65_03205 [Candidatus Saccharibacteria bacterium RIFCSPHIGHO2_12_FULL_47_16b]|nr:MAG: hypothetical protein A3F65_03205 [Candidatus Saccharibacteria bacterium RIFCSPHIGHO2_12_FULL_47_16b]
MPDELIIFLVGLVTSFLAGLSGGGAGLIILPVLIGLGLGPIESLGALKMGLIGLVVSSLFSKSARPHVRKDHLRPLILIAAVASVLGPLLAFNLTDSQVKFFSGGLILVVAVASLLTWKIASHTRQVSKKSEYIGYASYFVGGAVLAGFGAGVSLLNNYIVIGLLGMSSLESISTRRMVGLVAVPIQFLMFALGGQVNYPAGWILIGAMAIGGLLGLNYAVKKGNEFVKKVMAATAIVLVILLFT